MIYTKEGEFAGYIDVMVSNKKEANEAEIQYASNEKFRNKGNITISLEEVLKDVFIEKSFDGLQIKPFFPKTEMKKVFLDINEDNYASQAVAKKSGFTKRGEHYEITGDEFLNRLSDERKQTTLFDEQEIGQATINIPTVEKDKAKKQIENPKIQQKQIDEIN